MTDRSTKSLVLLAMSLAVAACAADDGGDDGADDTTGGTMTTTVTTTMTTTMTTTASTTADTTDGESESGGPTECPGTGGAAAVGDACTSNGDCESGVCTIFTDVPLNDDAVCGETPEGCSTRVTGTVFDFSTRMPVADASMKVAGAIAAVANPPEAPALATTTSGADGRVDVTTDVAVKQAVAIVALVESPSGYLTATGLASPVDEMNNYAVGTGIHDLWLVPSGPLGMWSTALGMDAEIPATSLPLGDAGGVIGLVRDSAGMPIAGAVVAPDDAGSGALIRYVNADNTVAADMTTETGIFIAVGVSQLGEDFTASMGGSPIPGASGTAGSANGAVFTLILNAD